ncbi:unnamed protein product [Rotaria sordida]|nr:unnamed protein product [Rotaria sordida]
MKWSVSETIIKSVNLMIDHCDSCRRYFKRDRNVHQQNNKPDYRDQYINENSISEENFNLNLSNETVTFATENLNQSRENSHVQSNYSNMTRTAFFSPSSYSLPNNDVQYTRNYSSLSTPSMANPSLLVLAYNEQESRKSLYP